MWLVVISILVLYTSMSHSSEGETSISVDSSRENVRAKIKFTDLNYDVTFVILEHLHLKELTSMAAISPELLSMSKQTFNQKYRDYVISIERLNDDANESASIFNVHKIIEIKSYNLLVQVLKNFGDLIRKVKLTRFISTQHLSVVNRMVNICGCESIMELDLNEISEDTFMQFKDPFNNLEILTFSVYGLRQPRLCMPFNEMFPNLRRLVITFDAPLVDYSFIDCKIAQLEHLYLIYELGGRIAKGRDDVIESLLNKNKQIKNIEIKYFPGKFIEKINQILPNIETLQVFDFEATKEIRFEHVKHFDMHHSSPRRIDRLEMPRLESMTMYYPSFHFDEWLIFLENHQYLKKLRLKAYDSDNDPRVTTITSHLPNLIELIVEGQSSMIVEQMDEILRNNEKLEKFEMNLRDSEERLISLRKEFGNDWNVTHSKRLGFLLFEKKH